MLLLGMLKGINVLSKKVNPSKSGDLQGIFFFVCFGGWPAGKYRGARSNVLWSEKYHVTGPWRGVCRGGPLTKKGKGI